MADNDDGLMASAQLIQGRVLFSAMTKCDWSTAKWLANQNKGLGYVHVDGCTLLHIAAKGNNIALVKILLDKGDDPNAVNAAGQSVVYVAAEYHAAPTLMELLLNAGGNINLADKQGWTPLVVATYKNAPTELILLMLQRGADRETVIKSGKSVYDFAMDKPKCFDQPDLVQLLNDPTSEVRPYAKPVGMAQRIKREASLSSASSKYSQATVPTSFTVNKPVQSPLRRRSRQSSSDPLKTKENKPLTPSEDPLVNADDGTGEVSKVAPSLTQEQIDIPEPVRLTSTAVMIAIDDAESEPPHLKPKQSVFLGFAPGEKIEKVQSLVHGLSERGFTVFADLNSTSTQSKLFQASKELEKASVFVACVSREYMYRVMAGSLEAAFFDIHAQEFTEAMDKLGERSMIPVILDPVLIERKLWKGPVGALMYNNEKVVDFSREDQLKEALDELEKHLYDL